MGPQDAIRTSERTHREPPKLGAAVVRGLLRKGIRERAGRRYGTSAEGAEGGREAVPGDAQRVPFAANLETAAMFCLVTKAGPVSTGAEPPPLKLPLDL